MMHACRINVLNCGILDTEGHTQDLLTIGHSKRLSHRKYIVGIFTKVMNYTNLKCNTFTSQIATSSLENFNSKNGINGINIINA